MNEPSSPLRVLPSKRVMLVDDEEAFTNALGNRLQHRGYVVVVAQDGHQALDLQRRQRVDAVILDLVMPGIDGLETLLQMRRANPDVQIIVLSGQANIPRMARAMKRGAVTVLEKPADFDSLVEYIETAIAHIHGVREDRLQRQVDVIIRQHGW